MKALIVLVLALALVVMMTTLAVAGPGAEAGGARFVTHAGPSPAECYWRPHPHSHEKSSLLFTSSDLRHGWWLITALPHCGVRPLAGFVLRWNRLLENALGDARQGYGTLEARHD